MKRIALLVAILLFAAPVFAGSVTLVWNPVTGATGYDIEQTVDGGTTWTVIASPAPSVCTGTPVTCSFTHTAPSSGLVLFRFAAKNAVGKATRFGEGAWHNETWKPPVQPANVGVQ